MPLAVMADAVLVVVTYLKNQADVVAIVGTKVTTKIEAALPRLRVVRIGGILAVPRRLDGAHIQFDAWAATEADARGLAATAHAAMWEASNVTNNGAVISGVEDTGGLQWLPDPTTNVPRYVFSQRVYIHPTP